MLTRIVGNAVTNVNDGVCMCVCVWGGGDLLHNISNITYRK